MDKSIMYGIIGLIVGAIVSGLFVSNQIQTNSEVTMQEMNHNMNNDMTMTDMVNSLKGKTGDEFDKAFISGMIEHHQGAIDMANEAKKSAKHNEIKSMADEIISAQSKEIEMMKQWQRDWGY